MTDSIDGGLGGPTAAATSGGATRGSTGCSSLTQRALIADLYGRPFLFMLPNAKQRYKSILGSMCTVFIISIVLIYAVYKYQLLIDKEESRLQKTLEENYFDETHAFSTAQGFNVAFALSSYSNKSQFFTDNSYGRLRLLLHTRENDGAVSKTTEIETHLCSQSDSDGRLPSSSSRFYSYK